jgi:hypothetical protein
MKHRMKRGLRRRYGHTARRGLPRSLKTVTDFAEHADDLRRMADRTLKLADQPWRSSENKAALRKTASRQVAEAQRADQEVMRLGGAP